MSRPFLKRLNRSHAAQTLLTMEEFYMAGKYWDVQLKIDTEVIRCERSLLATLSEYFDVLFNSNFNASRDQPIILHEIDVTAFKDILHFMYTGDIDVNDSNIFELLFIDDYLRLRIPYIREQCIEYLKTQNEPNKSPMSNVFKLLSFASRTANCGLVNTLNTHICQHLYHYSKDAKLIEIPFESLNELVKFSKHYISPVCGSQNVLLNIILTWIDHDSEQRGKYWWELVRCINFSNLSSKFTSLLTSGLDKFTYNKIVNNNSLFETFRTILREKMNIYLTTIDNARRNATITLMMEISPLKKVYSSSCIVSNMSWRISINYNRDGFLSFSLYCEGPSIRYNYVLWKCSVTANIIVVSQKQGGSNFVYKLNNFTLSFRTTSFCDHKFIKLADLIDPEKGYVKDNSVTFLAEVFADVPYGRTLHF